MPERADPSRLADRAAREHHLSYVHAVVRLVELGERWFDVPHQTGDVAKFLRDFYVAWVSPRPFCFCVF